MLYWQFGADPAKGALVVGPSHQRIPRRDTKDVSHCVKGGYHDGSRSFDSRRVRNHGMVSAWRNFLKSAADTTATVPFAISHRVE